MALIQQLTQEEIRKQILHTWESAQHSVGGPHTPLGPFDVSLNKGVWFLFIGAAITFLIMFVGARYLKDRPGMYQVIVEELYGFGRNHLGGQVAEEGKKWFPYTLSLFVFILVLNLIGLFPGSYPVTSSISFTLTLALLTFILTQFEGVRRNGLVEVRQELRAAGVAGQADHGPVHGVHRACAGALQAAHARDAALRQHPGRAPDHLRLPQLHPVLRDVYGCDLPSQPRLSSSRSRSSSRSLQAYIFAILTQVYIELAMFREDH